jgi:hypothetical protein
MFDTNGAFSILGYPRRVLWQLPPIIGIVPRSVNLTQSEEDSWRGVSSQVSAAAHVMTARFLEEWSSVKK